jgi:hypothetical protein
MLYGNVPSAVAFVGMGIVLLAGLYGVVSHTTTCGRQAYPGQMADARKNAETPGLEQAEGSRTLIADEGVVETYSSTS